jgi:hypothetical protein
MVVLLYQFWIHTEHIGRLGWLDRVFSTPSNHRVHHAVNPQYLDKNYGAIFVIWDRLFGSFAPEREPCVSGTVTPLASWNPLWAVGHFYVELWSRMRATPRWADKCRVLFKAPGWAPPGVAVAALPVGDRLARSRFDPAVPRVGAWLGLGVFLTLGAGTGLWLLGADELSLPLNGAALAALAGGLWCVGRSLTVPPRQAWVLAGVGLALACGLAALAALAP